MPQRANPKKRWCWGLCRSYYLRLYPFIVIALVWSLVWSWHNVTLRDFSAHSIAAPALIDEGLPLSAASSLPRISQIGNAEMMDDKDDVPAAYNYASDENANTTPREAALAKNRGSRESNFGVVESSSRLRSSSPKEYVDSGGEELEEGEPDKMRTVGGDGESDAAVNSSSSSRSAGGKFLPPMETSINGGGEDDDVYHDQKTFQEEYKQMLASFKIFVYPDHMQNNDPFSNIFAPTKHESRSNYASESYFKRALFKSHFITENASEAAMFYLPFSISLLRHDKRVGIRRMDRFISSYIATIRQKWPFWNRTGGADHFFVSCHSITKLASENVVYLRRNAIQVVCSSNMFVRGYVPHKDIPIPQVWPRKGTPPQSKLIDQRKVLAFFAGSANSPVRASLVKTWSHDTDILVYSKRLSTSYSRALLTTKFCLHVKGYEVNTARIADALHFGCVPVILADHYDLPFSSVLDWSKFSLVVETTDIPLLKHVLQQEVSFQRYQGMQKNVVKVRRHFQWNAPPCEYDAFYMTLYELWSRRHVTRSVII